MNITASFKFFALFLSLLLLSPAAFAEKSVTPDEAFLKSVVLLRPGIADLGELPVSGFVEVVKKSKMDNGKSPEVKGWSKTSDGYALNVVGIKPYRLEFLWTGGDSSLLKPITIDYQQIPAMLYVMSLGGP